MKLYFLPIIFLVISCSEEKKSESTGSRASKLPFPLVRNLEISKEDLKKLETNEFKSKFSAIKPGEFMMGSPKGEYGRGADEYLHEVQLTDPFYISKFETTINDWNTVYPSLKRNPSFHIHEEEISIILAIYKNLKTRPSSKDILTPTFQKKFDDLQKEGIKLSELRLKQLEVIFSYWKKLSANQKTGIGKPLGFTAKEITTKLQQIQDKQIYIPITQVSYTQAVAYCHKLTEIKYSRGELPDKMVYRLPTEAEWEYACRAGMNGVCGLGDGESLSGMNANLDGSRRDLIIGRDLTLINRGNLIPVGAKLTRFKPNKWGIYDMHGSVKEWCYDFYGYYSEGEAINPIGPLQGSMRVLRGGSFYRSAYECRSATRDKLDPSWRGSEIGFRVVLGFRLR